MGVMNFEMEAATIFTLCTIFGLRGGAACVVVADRFRNEFKPEGADVVLARLGAEALLALSQMDAWKQRSGRAWYVPELETP
jgi:uridine phosphorylase